MFTDASIIYESIAQIRQAARLHGFAVIAYCFMPDHLHLLVVATAQDSDLLAFAHAVKQRTAYQYRRKHRGLLWQKGYYEHIVRDDEATLSIARYILENPVRAGLVMEPRAYEFSGSFVLEPRQLDELWQCEAESLGEVGL